MNMIKDQKEARAVLRKSEAHIEPNTLSFWKRGFWKELQLVAENSSLVFVTAHEQSYYCKY